MPYRRTGPAGRQDTNHAEVRDVFLKAGCTVEDTSDIGGGFVDLLVAKRGRLVMVEVKDGKKRPSKRRLTDDEVKFAAKWRAAGIAVEIVETIEQAAALAGRL